MGQAEMDDAPASGFQKAGAAVMEANYRLAGGLTHDLDVLPSQLGSDPGAEGFADGFLGGKARGEGGHWVRLGEAIGELGLAQDASGETLAMSLPDLADATEFNDINAQAQNHSFLQLVNSPGLHTLFTSTD
jgi:hypothetical protein